MSPLVHLKISGKLDSLQRRHASKEVIFFVVIFLFLLFSKSKKNVFRFELSTFLLYLQYYSISERQDIQGGHSNIMNTET